MLALTTSIPTIDPAATAGSNPAGAAGSLFSQVAPWLGMLALVVIAGWIVILFVRRSMRAESEAQVGFTLEDLRRLHRAGEISGEEFERAKSAMFAQRPTRESVAAKGKKPDRQRRNG